MKGERWLPVPGYEGRYAVSTGGRVLSYLGRAPAGRILKRGVNRNGYPRVVLVKEGKRWSVTIHTLVLLAFVGKRPAGHQARHLNGRVKDARLKNLRWGTDVENKADMVLHGTRPLGEARTNARLTAGDVRYLRKWRQRGMTWKALGELKNVHQNTARNACLGLTWGHVS